jgi:hypothetical protein
MALDIPCPYCSATVRVPSAYLGGGVRCPRCAMVVPVELTGVTADAPPDARQAPWPHAADEIKLPEPRLPRARRYEPGRGRLLLALGLASLGVSVLGMVAGAFLCGAPVLFGPPAFGLGLAAWMMGQRDMEKLRLAIIDPYADRLTRGGWICGMVGTILGILVTLCGACGGTLQLLALQGSGP